MPQTSRTRNAKHMSIGSWFMGGWGQSLGSSIEMACHPYNCAALPHSLRLFVIVWFTYFSISSALCFKEESRMVSYDSCVQLTTYKSQSQPCS